MNQKTKRHDWSDIRSRLYSLADAIGATCCDSWPVPMRKVVECRRTLANRQLPVQIFFRPLWADGCVVVTDDGFEIYVSCRREEVEDFQVRYQAETQGRGLPRRVRYTIAHEIGHTLLYDSLGGDPRSRVKADHHSILRALENSCEIAAGRILLPTNLVRTEMQNGRAYDPDTLRAFADKAKVSYSAIVQRLGEMGTVLGDQGAFGYVQQSAKEILSFSAHASVRPIFHNLRKGQPLSTFLRLATNDFVLNGGNNYVETVEFKEQPQWARHFELRCETEKSRAAHQGTFITARLLTTPPSTEVGGFLPLN